MDANDTMKTTKCPVVVIMMTWTEEVLKRASVIHADLHDLDHHDQWGIARRFQCGQAKEMFDGNRPTLMMF